MFIPVRRGTSCAGTARRSPGNRARSEERGQGDAHLDARELGPEALVDAVPEAELSGGPAADIERVGVGEAERVAVGGLDGEGDALAGQPIRTDGHADRRRLRTLTSS